jgi:hypothetical protein
LAGQGQRDDGTRTVVKDVVAQDEDRAQTGLFMAFDGMEVRAVDVTSQ